MSDYATLGLDSTATDEEVKVAYRKLAKKHHPDLNNGDDAKFKEVKGAYERIISGNPYGQSSGFSGFSGNGSSHRNPFEGFANSHYGFDRAEDMEEILRHMRNMGMDDFGFGSRERKSGNVSTKLHMSFKESVFGGSFKIKYNQKQNLNSSEYETCPTCKGSGKFRRSIGLSLKKDKCMNCNGTGKVGKYTRSTEQEFVFNSPKGLSSGKKIVFRGKGHQDQEVDGDLFVEIVVKDNPYYTMVDGKDVHVHVPITMSQAILGGEILIQNLEMKFVKLFIPANTYDGKAFALRGMGVPEKGDLIVHVVIKLPESVTKEEKELLRRLDTLNKNSGNHDPIKIR